MKLTPLQLDMIRDRRRRLTGDVWHEDDAEFIGDQLREDLDNLLAEVDRLRKSEAGLLAACKFALEGEQGRDRPDGWTIENLEAAIAKAEGRKPCPG